MFRDSERSAGDQATFDPSARTRRDRVLLIAIGVLVPALVFGPALLAPELESLAPGSHLGDGRAGDGDAEAAVSSSGWHTAIERGLGPVGPVPGAGLGRPGD